MLDVLLGSPLDDCWNVDGDRGLSAVDQFYPVHNINEKPPIGYTWSVERSTKVQATSTPDFSGQMICRICRKHLNKKKYGIVPLESRSSTMLEN